MSPGTRGFTLIEILIALAIFAIVVVGALGVIGAANTSGFLEGIPTALVTGRTSKDITAASTYLRGFQEYMAGTMDGATSPGTYSFTTSASDIFGYPVPSAQPYQLAWSGMTVTIDNWYWVCGWDYYAPGGGATADRLVRVQTTLSWLFGAAARSVAVDRFVPYHPDVPFPGSVCGP